MFISQTSCNDNMSYLLSSCAVSRVTQEKAKVLAFSRTDGLHDGVSSVELKFSLLDSRLKIPMRQNTSLCQYESATQI